jgi:prefoldin subunit 5
MGLEEALEKAYQAAPKVLKKHIEHLEWERRRLRKKLEIISSTCDI